MPRKPSKKDKKIKFNDREWEISRILVDEMIGWKSTEAVSMQEFRKLVLRLSDYAKKTKQKK